MAIQPLYPSTRPSLLLDFANTKTLDPRIAFSRASTATYYDGKTFAKAEENLLSYSQEFDNAYWVGSNRTITANATTAPDGTTTADKIVATVATGYHTVAKSFNFENTLTYTLSIYVKSAEYTKFYISDGNGGRYYCSFDLGAGTAGTPGGSYTNKSAGIVSAANGYYRCSITFTSTETATRSISTIGYPDTGATLDLYGAQYTGDGTSGIYIWGAQLEQRSSATAYTPTTSQPITNYIPVLQTAASGIARFNHDPVTGESLGLLIEEQRTNLLLRSQEFDDAVWSKSASTISANSSVAPDGTLTGDKLVEDASIGGHLVFQTIALADSTTYTASVFVKAAERTWVAVGLIDKAGITNRVWFNSSTGAQGTTNGTVSAASARSARNGWWQFSVSVSSATGATTPGFRISMGSADNTASYTGDGYSGIYIWGAQLEAGSFPTSYIPTTTAQATRAAESAVMTGSNFSSWYRQDEGTLYAEASTLKTSGSAPVFIVQDSGGSSRHQLAMLSPVAATVTSDVVQSSIGSSTAQSSKLAYTYKVNDFALSVNSGTVATDSVGSIPTVTYASFGKFDFGGAASLSGHIKRIAYYPSRLSNSVIQALTT